MLPLMATALWIAHRSPCSGAPEVSTCPVAHLQAETLQQVLTLEFCLVLPSLPYTTEMSRQVRVLLLSQWGPTGPPKPDLLADHSRPLARLDDRRKCGYWAFPS